MQILNGAPHDTPLGDVASDDLMDAVTGLIPSDPLYAVRHAREKVAVAMQKSYDVFFDATARGLSLSERFSVALYASVLSRSEALAGHYEQALLGQGVEPGVLDAMLTDRLDAVSNNRLRIMLGFTRKLIVKPVEGDAAEIERLRSAGVATPDIVTLAQLIAFLSYQIRVAAGLRAMKELESQ
ncbi:MAG TPA: CMD domain protein [Burkholderiaceae bacterium]|nr:CMD domain protein [Burkholderiaceae bacterium]